MYKIAKEQVQFHNNTDSMVQSQLKGIISRKHYACLKPFYNSYSIEKHTGRKQYCVWKIVIKERGETKN